MIALFKTTRFCMVLHCYCLKVSTPQLDHKHIKGIDKPSSIHACQAPGMLVRIHRQFLQAFGFVFCMEDFGGMEHNTLHGYVYTHQVTPRYML